MTIVRKLFVEELRRIEGGGLGNGEVPPGWQKNGKVPPGLAKKFGCPEFTTLACGEEAFGCSGC